MLGNSAVSLLAFDSRPQCAFDDPLESAPRNECSTGLVSDGSRHGSARGVLVSETSCCHCRSMPQLRSSS